MKIKHITLKHKDYPQSLRNIPSSPKNLYYLGNLDLVSANSILSVVGTRKPTTYGRQIITQLIPEVAKAEVVVVSGLALGVDGLAHRACLEASGKTIAVMGCGLDKIYPTSHRELAKNILESGGLIISEYEVGMPALPQNFIARNRIISGLSNATLIVEAAIKSGSLHTANFALEQGKTILAVPGNITSPMSAGTNQLIKTGATPISSGKEILQSLGIDTQDYAKKSARGNNPAEQAIIDLLNTNITDGDELQTLSKLSAVEFQQTMTMLEITGTIHPLGANHWNL